MAISILLVDQHKIMRDGLRARLEQEGDIEVIDEAKDGRTAVQLAISLSPDLVVMESELPDITGIEAMRQIHARSADIKIIILSRQADDRQLVMATFGAGAASYLLRDCALEELTRAIRTVKTNQIYLSPSITRLVVQDYLGRRAGVSLPIAGGLTPRECEVLRLLAQGHRTRDIAEQLSLSPKTIETHRAQIMEKLNLYTIAGLTKYAIRKGLISL